ncbi:MAG: hypothetical protein HY231_25395 [Acidobacteria bacterium]|nr:hypothetical protein [Acidobacteriota bacterium]
MQSAAKQNAKPHSRRQEFVCFALLVIGTVVVFALLFNKENSLSYSIGYNLYGAARVLGGEIPYRDFHTLYPPATIYLNAAIFKAFGVTLFNALFGVLIFKVLTTLMLYGCARRLMPWAWALSAAAFSLVWLRPNGPFKAVPMHYGAWFLAAALFFILSKKVNKTGLFFAGVALGLLALCKHNIGAYALAGALVVVLLDDGAPAVSVKQWLGNYRRAGWLILGCAATVLPLAVYMQTKTALAPMMKTLLFGPGEFLLTRLAAVPLPIIPMLFALWLVMGGYLARRFQAQAALALAILAITLAGASLFLWFARQDYVDALIFYAPVMTILAGFGFSGFGKRFGVENPKAMLAVTVCAAAAFMEAFPRFAREQSIASMPFVALLLLYLLFSLRAAIAAFALDQWRFKLALVTLPLIIFSLGGRLFLQTFFDSRLHCKSDTELSLERGRKVFFPAEKANEINQTVAYLQERVPVGGYFFAQSYAGSSYLFLADRNNPSGAQFWGGVGVKDAERAATLEALQRQRVGLIVTSRKDLAAEKYQPMRDFINQNFTLSREFGETLILER